jgi:hypothetical protein
MPYHHLTESHRRLIEDLHQAGNSNRAIGRLMGRCHTTMGRELKRNSHHGVYDSQITEPRAQHRLPINPGAGRAWNHRNSIRPLLKGLSGGGRLRSSAPSYANRIPMTPAGT